MRSKQATELAQLLVDQAVSSSGKDNVTAIVFECLEDTNATLG